MAINRIYDENDSYEVGQDDISKINLTDHGNKNTTIYKVTYEDDTFLFVGLIEHEVVQWDLGDQADIFDYL